MSTKMKGLLKGLRYISQIFENETEPEMMIGNPTDVKHVAHIGWDGPSVTSPSWMTEFKSSPRHSAPLDAIDKDMFKDDAGSQHGSEGSSRGGARSQSCHGSPGRELPELPKSTRRNSSTGTSGDSPTKAKSERVRQPRKSSKGTTGKDPADGSKQLSEDGIGEVDSPTRRQHPEIPKKSRRKKSKDSGGGSTRSSSRTKAKSSSSPGHDVCSDLGTNEGSVSSTKDRDPSWSTRRGAREVAEDEDEKLQLPIIPDRYI
ncbi:hypothetical protein MLD38_038315 [Melastoma candidum]|uniref:Uncharacterized protein n=1 Tax=Melastoma candidum TaxID=119954 RepID=A0ACB9KZ84_9MYRT|nr:hypothetical protein MLD38_038315 [Melastoma candidum]